MPPLKNERRHENNQPNKQNNPLASANKSHSWPAAGKDGCCTLPSRHLGELLPLSSFPRRNKEYCLGVGYTYQAWRSSNQKPSLSRTVLLFAKMKQAALVSFASWDLREKSLISAPIQFGISLHQMKFKKCL